MPMLNTRPVEFPEDPGLVEVLEEFGVQPRDLLGHGGEAWVYALDQHRVIRVLHAGGTAELLLASAELAQRLSGSEPPFALPSVIDIGEVHGRWYAIERRLAGRPVLEELAHVEDRAALIKAYLECSFSLGDLALDQEDWWGDLVAPEPVRAESWTDYLRRKAEASLRIAGRDFAAIDAAGLAEAMPSPTSRSFVHLDAFPGNMLAIGARVTAVLDLGASAIAGDRRLDPLASVVYLHSAITPTAGDRDREVARSWLRDVGLAEFLLPAQRWLAAYWAFAVDDQRLRAWCRSVLLGEA